MTACAPGPALGARVVFLCLAKSLSLRRCSGCARSQASKTESLRQYPWLGISEGEMQGSGVSFRYAGSELCRAPVPSSCMLSLPSTPCPGTQAMVTTVPRTLSLLHLLTMLLIGGVLLVAFEIVFAWSATEFAEHRAFWSLCILPSWC